MVTAEVPELTTPRQMSHGTLANEMGTTGQVMPTGTSQL